MKKVLAIVRDQQVQDAIVQALSASDYYLLFAKSGFEGILMAKSEKPDLFICNCDLPDMTGKSIITELGSHGLLTFSPFIFVIENDWDRNSSSLMGYDMDAIIKEFNIKSDLIDVMEEVVREKLAHIDSLNHAQNEFNKEYLGTSKENDQSPEEMRKRLLVIQKLFPLIKLGRMSYNAGIEVLDYQNDELDDKILAANKFINIGKHIETTRDGFKLAVKDIWLIDDDPTQNLLNKIVLKQINPSWKISEFHDANRAFQALSTRKPDLVFLDINMPGMSGFEFLKKLTVNKINLNVIMLSSSVSSEEIKESLQFDQVINYFNKPILREKVNNMITAIN